MLFEGMILPFLGMNLSLLRSSTAGRRKASVLPLPVFAAPIKSLKTFNILVVYS